MSKSISKFATPTKAKNTDSYNFHCSIDMKFGMQIKDTYVQVFLKN